MFHSAYVPIPMEAVAVNVSAADQDLTGFTLGYARRLYIGVTGDVKVKYLGNDTAITYVAVPAGSYIDGAFVTVVKSGTTATSVVAES